MKCLYEQPHVKRLVLDRKNIYHYFKDAIFLKNVFRPDFILTPPNYSPPKKAQKPREAKPSFRAILSKLERTIQSN